MNWSEYRRLCDRTHVMSRWMLEQTAELLDSTGYGDHAAAVRAQLQGQPLEKPPDFLAGAETDMFECRLPRPQVAAIVNVIQAAAGAGVTTAATRSRGLGGFAEAWGEYLGELNDGDKG